MMIGRRFLLLGVPINVPWESKSTINSMVGWTEKNIIHIIFVGIYKEQFQRTIILMVFDLQGVYMF